MRVIALNDDTTEIFNEVDKIEEVDPSWIEVDGTGNISADVFLVFRDS